MRQGNKQAPQSAEETVRDIRRATRRHFSAEEKIRIVLEGLPGEDSISELCRKEGIAQNLYYRCSRSSWKPARSGSPATRPVRTMTISVQLGKTCVSTTKVGRDNIIPIAPGPPTFPVGSPDRFHRRMMSISSACFMLNVTTPPVGGGASAKRSP